jgi:hypothetical protein
MKPYGRQRGDSGCCPGHDTFPSETYANRRSKRAQTRDTVIQHQRARAQQKTETREAVSEAETCQ